MKEWFNNLFLTDEALGDKILNILFGIFIIIFISGWAILIFWFIFHLIIDFLKWTREKIGIPNYRFIYKLISIEDKMENIFKLQLKIIPDSFNLSLYNKAKVSFYKSIGIGISIPVIASIIWLVSSFSPINDFLLITKSNSAKGFITEAREETEVVEYNDGRSTNLVYYYNYNYNFLLPNGKEIKAFGSEPGTLPDYLRNLETPHQVIVEYLANNPKISRVKGMQSNYTSISQLIRHKMIIQIIVFLFFCYWGYTIVKNGWKKYKLEKHSELVDDEKFV